MTISEMLEYSFLVARSMSTSRTTANSSVPRRPDRLWATTAQATSGAVFPPQELSAERRDARTMAG